MRVWVGVVSVALFGWYDVYLFGYFMIYEVGSGSPTSSRRVSKDGESCLGVRVSGVILKTVSYNLVGSFRARMYFDALPPPPRARVLYTIPHQLFYL